MKQQNFPLRRLERQACAAGRVLSAAEREGARAIRTKKKRGA